MYQKIGKMGTYHYIFCDTVGLLLFLKFNEKISQSLVDIMEEHRGHEFNIIDFVIEYFDAKEKNNETLYLFLFDDNEIITTSRLIYNNKTGYINAVHTNKKFRGKKLCQKTIKRLITLATKKTNIKKIELDVEVDNIPAIKCYERSGFRIIKKFSDYYKMRMSIQ